MAFWNRREKRALSDLSDPADWLLDSLGGSPATSGQRVTVEKSIGIASVYAAVGLLSGQIGLLPFKVYRRVDDQRVEARNHPAWRLLNQRPNASTPAGRFWATVAVHLLLYGNAFIEKIGRGSDMELQLLLPSEVTVKWWPGLREKTFVHSPASGVISGSPNTNRQRELDSEDVLHIMNMSLDGITGLSVISACRNPLGAVLARDEFEGTFYRQGTVLSGYVKTPGVLKSDVALKRLKDSLKALFAGSARAHGVAVFEEGAEFVNVTSPLVDLQFVESKNMSRTDVANLFNIPPNYLGGSSGDSLTYATVEANSIQLAQMAVAPLTNTIAEAVSQDPSILPQNVFDAEFVLEGMMRGDAKTRAEFYEKLVGMKAMHPDEVRQKENLPPLTPSQKKELNPAPVVAPQLPGLEEAMANANGNGNGNSDPQGE